LRALCALADRVADVLFRDLQGEELSKEEKKKLKEAKKAAKAAKAAKA